MLLPWLIGQLFESAGPQITMIAILVDLVAAVGVFAVLLRTDSEVVGIGLSGPAGEAQNG
jgi:hypothetical protein